MENLKKLWNELKPKENKYVLEGSNLKIGKGVIACNDNEIIPLDAISFKVYIYIADRNYFSFHFCTDYQNHWDLYAFGRRIHYNKYFL
mgnify:CR=1 FL=1